jgi:hypothetical protein
MRQGNPAVSPSTFGSPLILLFPLRNDLLARFKNIRPLILILAVLLTAQNFLKAIYWIVGNAR